MAALSDYLENKMLDWLLRGVTFTPPATTYVGLYTVNPTDTGGGTEVTGGSYARVAVASSLTNWAGTQSAGSTVASTGTSGTTSNDVAVTFPQSTAAWGTITGFGIFDAATGGNLLIYAPLTITQNVPSNATLSFAPGTLTFQDDN